MRRKDFVYRVLQFIVVLGLFAFGVWIIQGDVKLHEDVHVEVFDDYGINSSVSLGFLEGHTMAYINISHEDYRFMELGHQVNDAVAYNINSLKWFLLFNNVLLLILVMRE